MGLRDLLVCVDQADAALSRLRLAADLASQHGSQLTALYVREWSSTQSEEQAIAELGLGTAKDIDRLHERIEASIDSNAQRLRSMLETLGHERGFSTEWCFVDGPPSVVVSQRARYADLCIVGRDAAAAETSIDYSFSEELLFVTGRPVLFIPPAPPFETLGRHIAVAWNSSRPAARAVNDALPLIEVSKKATILMANPTEFIDRRGALPPDRLVEHLTRHGAVTDLLLLEHVPAGSVARALQTKAREIGADLLVAGAFGHPKLWEKLLGGVTRDLLDHTRLPIFMSY